MYTAGQNLFYLVYFPGHRKNPKSKRPLPLFLFILDCTVYFPAQSYNPKSISSFFLDAINYYFPGLRIQVKILGGSLGAAQPNFQYFPPFSAYFSLGRAYGAPNFPHFYLMWPRRTFFLDSTLFISDGPEKIQNLDSVLLFFWIWGYLFLPAPKKSKI